MILQEVTKSTLREDGKWDVVADILSTDAPSPMPVNGEDIDGLTEKDILAPGSSIYVVSGTELYMMGEDRTFYQQGG